MKRCSGSLIAVRRRTPYRRAAALINGKPPGRAGAPPRFRFRAKQSSAREPTMLAWIVRSSRLVHINADDCVQAKGAARRCGRGTTSGMSSCMESESGSPPRHGSRSSSVARACAEPLGTAVWLLERERRCRGWRPSPGLHGVFAWSHATGDRAQNTRDHGIGRSGPRLLRWSRRASRSLRRDDRAVTIVFRLPPSAAERVAFSYSPVLEAVLSLHVLVERKHHPVQHEWVRTHPASRMTVPSPCR
jgi:hypothetical protein